MAETAHIFRVQLGDGNLNFRPVMIADPIVTGQQILDLAEVRPASEHVAYILLPNGLLEALRPDETVDLQAKGAERFIIFHTDRSFRFELDGRDFDWGAPLISGATLKALAQVDPATHGVWQEIRGQEDKPIGDHDFVNLAERGVERIFTGIKSTTEG